MKFNDYRYGVWTVLAAVILNISLDGISAPAQADDKVTTVVTDTLVVRDQTLATGQASRRVDPTRDLGHVLDRSPFVLIRKGAASSADLYVDGFKRSDIIFTIDGERFTTACPNRMDTRMGQINLLDVARVELDRTGAGLQAGLGGHVEFRRRLPGEETMVRGRLMGAFDSSEEFDAGVAAEGNRMRFSSRFRRSAPWTDADGGEFNERYGFAETPDATIFEVQGTRAWDDGHAVATFETARDLLFPYLLMDERENEHYQASVSHRGHRLYFNRNEHLMDNGLRASIAQTDMVTDATNTMVGAVGERYEVFVRNWDADNRITPVANPAAAIDNHMLPDVTRVYASVRQAHTVGEVDLAARLGLARTSVGDDQVVSRYEELESGVDTERWSVPFGLSAARPVHFGEAAMLGLSAEVASDPPSIEQMYIAVDKPGTKPTWLGNPALKDPVRATVRAAWTMARVRGEVFGTRVWNYPYLTKVSANGGMYQTYDCVDALLAGASLSYGWSYVDASLRWNWGQKKDNAPLAEIQPVLISLSASTPVSRGFRGRARYQHAVAQTRVDTALDEKTTPVWDRVDLGVEWERDHWKVAFDLENLFDEFYTQHLSYLRNPFAAGMSVYEPGRTVRLAATLVY